MYLLYLKSTIFINKGVFEHSNMALTETICEYQTQPIYRLQQIFVKYPSNSVKYGQVALRVWVIFGYNARTIYRINTTDSLFY